MYSWQWCFLLQYSTTGSRPDLTERSPAEEHSVGAWCGGLHWTRHKAHAGIFGGYYLQLQKYVNLRKSSVWWTDSYFIFSTYFLLIFHWCCLTNQWHTIFKTCRTAWANMYVTNLFLHQILMFRHFILPSNLLHVFSSPEHVLCGCCFQSTEREHHHWPHFRYFCLPQLSCHVLPRIPLGLLWSCPTWSVSPTFRSLCCLAAC